MNKKVVLQDLGLKDYKETWDYQEQLFQDTLDIKIRNRREELALETPNYFYLLSTHMFIHLAKVAILIIY